MNGRDLLLLCNFIFSLVGGVGICVYSSLVVDRWYPWMVYAKYDAQTFIQAVMANCVLSAASLVATWVLWLFIRKEKCCGWIFKIVTICTVVMALVTNATVMAFNNNKYLPGIMTNVTGMINFNNDQRIEYGKYLADRYKGHTPSEIAKITQDDYDLVYKEYSANLQIFFYFQILFTFLTIFQIVDIACCDSVGEIEKKLTC